MKCDIKKEVMPRAWPLCVVFFSPQAHLFMCNSKTLASKLLLFKGEEEVVTTPLPPSNCSLLCPRHGVWKSQKKSYLTLRAKRATHATFTFWVDKSLSKMVRFGKFLKTLSLRSNSVTRHVSFDRLIGQKLVENAKSKNFKCDISGDF